MREPCFAAPTAPVVEFHAEKEWGQVIHAVEWLPNRGWRTLCGQWVNGSWRQIVRVDHDPPPLTCANCLRTSHSQKEPSC